MRQANAGEEYKRTCEEATRSPRRRAQECPDLFQPAVALRWWSGTGSAHAVTLLSPEGTEVIVKAQTALLPEVGEVGVWGEGKGRMKSAFRCMGSGEYTRTSRDGKPSTRYMFR